MKYLILKLTFLLASITLYSQEFDSYNEDLIINSISIGFSSEEDLEDAFGAPNEIKEELDFLGDGKIKKYCYDNSYFTVRKGKVSEFLVRDEDFVLDNFIEVGMGLVSISNVFPISFENRKSVSEIELEYFNADNKIWIWIGPSDYGGDGIIIYFNDEKVIGYRYSSSF